MKATNSRNPAILAVSALLVATLAPAAGALAQEWPTKAVTIVVPYPAGGLTDVVTRPIAIELSKRIGQPVIVENRAGAAGRIGMDFVKRAPKDGHTIGLVVPATMASLPAIDPKLAYDPITDFTPISIAVDTYLMLVVNPEFPARNIQEFIARAKAEAGKLHYGTPGSGTTFHFNNIIFAQEAGFQAAHIPYKGEAPALNDLLGNQIQYLLATSAAKPLVDAGKLRALAVTSKTRIAAHPALPTMLEQGVNLVTQGWVGYVAPAGVPAPTAARITAAFREATNAPEVAKFLGERGFIVRATVAEELQRDVEAGLKRYRSLVASGVVKIAD